MSSIFRISPSANTNLVNMDTLHHLDGLPFLHPTSHLLTCTPVNVNKYLGTRKLLEIIGAYSGGWGGLHNAQKAFQSPSYFRIFGKTKK